MVFHSNIAKYRGDALPTQGMGGGDEGEGRYDNFALQIQGSLEQSQSGGGIAYANAVLDSEHRRNAFFKLEGEPTLFPGPAGWGGPHDRLVLQPVKFYLLRWARKPFTYPFGQLGGA